MNLKIANVVLFFGWLGALSGSVSIQAADFDPNAEGNFVIGPIYTNAPELTVKEGVPRGTLHVFTMNSEDSRIYPGIAKNRPGEIGRASCRERV